jgi:type II secretory pathway component GspD/PulD (secretin)
MITVNDINDQLEEIKTLILALDQRSPQVLVEAQIVEVQMGNVTELDTAFNISYFDKDKETVSTIGSVQGGRKGYPAAPRVDVYPDEGGGWYDMTPFNKELSNGDIIKLNAKLKWLETNGKAEILSSPNLLVDLGTTATVSTGTDQPLLSVSVNNGVSQEEVYYKRTGVNLRVTPQMINDDAVSIEVRPEVTSVVGYASLSSSSEPPIISVRNIETKLNVRDGGVVMMGGLYSSKDIESEEKVPFFGDLPWIGFLFRSKSTDKEQVQLVFLLRVSIIHDAPETYLKNLDTTQEEVKGVGSILKRSIGPVEPVEMEPSGEESVPGE